MATSPNYGWAEPDNSSLVKNGAQDIRALGDAIDTSLWNVGYGQAGKNKIINGDFAINQRAFTTTSTNSIYMYDRFVSVVGGDGTATYSAQTFTPGAAPVAGYEAANFIRIVTSGQTSSSVDTRLQQKIENVRTFAGQTITVSLWAKASTGTPSLTAEITQNFGSGGSPSANVTSILDATPKRAITSSWARYSWTINVPSISGKTIGTTANTSHLLLNIFVSAGSDLNSRTGTLGIQNNTFDIWGVQAEYGSIATPFQTATGTIQGELAACQRYYQAIGGTANAYPIIQTYSPANGTDLRQSISFPVKMRTAPTATKNGTWTVGTCGQPTADYLSPEGFALRVTSTGAGTVYAYPDSTDDTITFSAEL